MATKPCCHYVLLASIETHNLASFQLPSTTVAYNTASDLIAYSHAQQHGEFIPSVIRNLKLIVVSLPVS